MLQDAHIHLQDVADAALRERMLAAGPVSGTGRFFCSATSPDDWDAVADLARQHAGVVPFFGLHPWFVDKAKAGWEDGLVKRLRQGARRAGVGEIGLDYRTGKPGSAAQTGAFAAQLDIARACNCPVAIHCVDAWGALLKELRAHPMEKVPFMVHLFSGSAEVLAELIELGAYLSFSTAIVQGAPARVIDAFGRTPLDRLLLETDYPYVRSKSGELPTDHGALLKTIYEEAARRKGVGREVFEKAVWDNGTLFVP